MEFLFLTRASGARHIGKGHCWTKLLFFSIWMATLCSIFLWCQFSYSLCFPLHSTLCTGESIQGLTHFQQVLWITELHPQYLSSFDVFLEGLGEVRLSSPKNEGYGYTLYNIEQLQNFTSHRNIRFWVLSFCRGVASRSSALLRALVENAWRSPR